jgi:hypothetical protein
MASSWGTQTQVPPLFSYEAISNGLYLQLMAGRVEA